MIGFYERIEELLKAQHKTRKEMACTVGMATQQVYTNSKSLGTIPRADIAVKIAQYLNTTVEYLITGEHPKSLEEKYRTCLESLYDTIKESLEGTKKNL